MHDCGLQPILMLYTIALAHIANFYGRINEMLMCVAIILATQCVLTVDIILYVLSTVVQNRSIW